MAAISILHHLWQIRVLRISASAGHQLTISHSLTQGTNELFLLLATDTYGQTQTIISADPAEIMVQALQRRAGLRLKSLQISANFGTTSFEVCAYLPNLPTTLKLRRDKLRQAQISIFREAMTFFIRMCQPNKTSVWACRVDLSRHSFDEG